MTALLKLFALFAALEPDESTSEAYAYYLDRQSKPEGCCLWEGEFYVLVEAGEAEVAEPAVEAEEPETKAEAEAPSKAKVGYSGVSKADNSLGSSVLPETPRSNPGLRPCFEACDTDGPYGPVGHFQAGCYGGKWYCPYTCEHASFNEWIADRRSPYGWRD